MEHLCGEGTVSGILGTGPRSRFTWSWRAANGSFLEAPSVPANKTECFVEVVNIAVAAIALVPPALLVLRYKWSGREKIKNETLLPHHDLRSLLCIGALLFLLLDFAGSIFDARLLLPLLSISVILTCWLLHRETELGNGLGVVATAGSFAVTAIARVWRLLYTHRLGLSLRHARVTATAGTAAFSGLLAIVDTYTLYKLMRESKKYTVSRPRTLRTSYRHNVAPLLSRITFHWVVELLRRGYSAPLDLDDLGRLPEEESTEVQLTKFFNIYEDERRRKKNGELSLWRCYWRRVWIGFLFGGVLKLFGDAASLAGPMAISGIISYVASVRNGTIADRGLGSGSFVTLDELTSNGYFLGLLVFLAAILQSTLSQSSTHVLNVEGIRLRSALQALVYDKALRLCSWSIAEDDKTPERGGPASGRQPGADAKHHRDVGTLTNLMAEDACNVMSFFWIGHYIWAVPLKIIAIIFLLYSNLGVSAIVGAVCCILIVTPMQLFLGKRMSTNSVSVTEHSDARLRLMNEVLQGMRLIKLRAWEELFEQRIASTRDEELKLLDRDSFYWALIAFLTHASSVLMTLFTFGVYFWVEERQLDAGNVFASLALFSQLTVPLHIFPVVVPIVINAKVSTTRLEEFLLLPETANVLPDEDSTLAAGEGDRTNGTNGTKGAKGIPEGGADAEATEAAFGALDNIEEAEEERNCHMGDCPASSSSADTVFRKESDLGQEPVLTVNGVFSWGSEENRLVVERLTFPRGKLSLIVGRIGAGKTSLLSASLGEIHTVSGYVRWSKGTRVAYVAQKPWLLNATLRENILFGSEYRPSRYRQVLRACALQPDVDILPGKDLTRIGEKGINLSGGQKQRIAIARAIYSDADTIILDDPLSALDQQVGQQVFDHGIQRLLLGRGRTVVMVTHRLELMPAAEQIVAMEGCAVRAVGSKSAIEHSDPALAAEWREAARRRDGRSKSQRTARDRWSLIRLVSRIGTGLRNGSWSTDQDAHVTPPAFVPLRRRRSTLAGSRYLTHDLTDLPVPSEEWGGVVARRSKRHRNAVRATSLQPPRNPPPVLRQSSTPTILDGRYAQPPRKRHNTLDSEQQTGPSKRFFSARTTPTEESENNHAARRLLSIESRYTEEDSRDDEDGISRTLEVEGGAEHDRDASGLVTARVCLDYFKAGGIGPGLVYASAALACQAIRVYTDLWLSGWTESGSRPDDTSDRHEETKSYFRVYVGLSIGSIALSVVYNAAGQWAGARARRIIHREAIVGILQAPLGFLEKIPIGRILDRFSADMGVVDKKLSTVVQRTTAFVLLCGSAMTVNAMISPWFLVAAVPTCAAYLMLQRFYRRSARELQRLDGSTRGPAAAHFSETLAGLPTLRAYKQQDRFMAEMMRHLDSNTNAFLISNTGTRWLGIALDYLGAVVVAAAIIAAVTSARFYPERVTPALVGLAVNYTLLVPIYLNWVVKFVSEIEMYMGSVARLTSYAKSPREEYRDDGPGVPDDWPRSGKVVFDNVSLRYDPAREPVVSNLRLVIPPGQKLGICGRTGSGKSSVAMALFRFVRVCEGRILVDDVDVERVPLRLLRSRLSAIPQDVMLFSGTVRQNLDPLGERSDDELWRALEVARMKEFVKSHPEGLDAEVREGGENFSAGQRQLLSMGRAALLASSIVVLDEATGALDAATEKSVLAEASAAFKDRTVVTVAHRVASLLDCDRVIVFDAGRVAEDGPPEELLRRPMGLFSAMLRSPDEEGVEKI